MNKKGFTLVELLAVIIIISMIALIAIPQVAKLMKQQQAKADLLNYKSVIEDLREVYLEDASGFSTMFSSIGSTPEFLNKYGIKSRSLSSITITLDDNKYNIEAYSKDNCTKFYYPNLTNITLNYNNIITTKLC